ncbi:hypothetical protein [Methylocystis heyeri]|uniref:Outer membrane assembly lipoprotein YfiO n=1 Tax=Methylocystis heyeri TaxID=391905 RepID=A0A6B8KH85_9HYPH|nr:hypothetical protein [Methylocystis heyeri]QGM46325.1 hypothetical protein H2LOC_011800 [Methylocystis heyeri]
MRQILLGAISCLLFLPGAAHACGGAGGPPAQHWSLDHKSYAGGAGLPFLSPGNDSRINLQLLTLDARSLTLPAGATPEASKDVDAASMFTIADLSSACGRIPAPGVAPPDASAASPALADGEGSRCLSLEAGRKAFVEAVQADKSLSEAERDALTAARARVTATCDDKTSPATSEDPLAGAPKPSAAARDFAAYLVAAQQFYDGAFDEARAGFEGLAKAQNAWLRESARYMVARTLLNKAQKGAFADFDGVPEPKVTDRASLDAAEAAFKSYLADYPAGRYAASARGLQRRIYWLAGDKARLAADYGARIKRAAGSATDPDIPALAQEIDLKYLGDGKAAAAEGVDPNLLAVADLMRMRREAGDKAPQFPAADLDAEAPRFSGNERLLAFLKAARAYYIDGDSATTLRLLGEAPAAFPPLSWVAFSAEMLRGQALLASARFSEAAEQFSRLLPLAAQPWRKEAVEVGLAMAWERAGTANKIFLPETRLSTPSVRAIILRHVAGPILLRMAVEDPSSIPAERRLARFVLLYKEATRGQYAGFLKDYSPEAVEKDDAGADPQEMTPKSTLFKWDGSAESYPCPTLKSVVAELAADPRSPHGLLCLGDFTRSSDLDDFEYDRPAPNELGGSKSIFPGEKFSRGEIYKKLIADPKTPDRKKAYALFRAVNCYAPVGANGCGGKDVDLRQRKAWHDQLKARYGATPWAKSLKYYW